MGDDNQKKPSIFRRVAKVLFVDLLGFFDSIGPILVGLFAGAVLGGVAAIVLSFSILSGVLVGAVTGFLLAFFVQVLILGGGL